MLVLTAIWNIKALLWVKNVCKYRKFKRHVMFIIGTEANGSVGKYKLHIAKIIFVVKYQLVVKSVH